MPNKTKPTISIEDMPIIITVAVLVVGLGTILGLLGYYIFGISKCVKPTIKAPSINVVENDYFGNNFIQVKFPKKSELISNPVLISGKANVFEANVRVKIKDENENILADTFITAAGAYDKLYPFEKEISYTAPASQNGLVEVFEESAKDGSDIHKVEIPVVFGDYVNIADWQTYRNEEYGFEFKYPTIYDEKEEYESCRLRESINKDVNPHLFISLASRVWLQILDPEGLTLSEYVDKKTDSELIELESKKTTLVGGKEAVSLTYRLLGSGAYGLMTLLEKDGKIYMFSLERPVSKCFEIENISVFTVYGKILSTFKFIEK